MLGHESVLRSEVGYAAECAAVVERVLEEELHTHVVDGLLGVVQLVVEEEIVVRILYDEAVSVLTSEVRTEHVEAGEHPASSRTLLVVDVL